MSAERLQSYSNTNTLVTRDGKKDVGIRVFGSRRMDMRRCNNIQSSNLARHFDPVIDTKRDQRVN